ncbi:rho GTPase-activating protein gacY [Galleria mellonella]|uniref:Rho GTPase-activating protein gacY n=1 Tax=Galleria mellonella TaxID=7137 RepID=A0A6J1WU50_GALME|nr:rho GTPase-activating protein gacY [Galleria mellonella]
MATTAGPRKTISIYNYPDHLNPFREEDNHNKIRFWTINSKLKRSNSISFSGLKDFRNSWSLRSFMKKGKKGQAQEKEKPNSPTVNGDNSVVEYRNTLQHTSHSMAANPARNTVASPERRLTADRYVYGGSVTPLPRSRFQERLRSPSNYEVNSTSATPRMARSELSGSRMSVGSTNPFDEDEPIPPVKAPRRKKRAAPLPPVTTTTADISVNSETSETSIANESQKINGDDDLEDINCNIELKIVEDEDIKKKEESTVTDHIEEEFNREPPIDTRVSTQDLQENFDIIENEKEDSQLNNENTVKTADSDDDILKNVAFSKVDIVKYRRNSSVNDDDIKLRRGNLEDFHTLSNKRSKSLTNTLDGSYVQCDINLNEDKINTDANGNEEPQKVVCKLYENTSRKQSIDELSNTEKEFIEIDKATRELEREISKLNTALAEDVEFTIQRRSVSDIKRIFDKNDISSPNPIPKPRRSHHGDITLSITENGDIQT